MNLGGVPHEEAKIQWISESGIKSIKDIKRVKMCDSRLMWLSE